MELRTIINLGTETEQIIFKDYSDEQCDIFAKFLERWVFEVSAEVFETRFSIKGYSSETYKCPSTVETVKIILSEAIVSNNEVVGACYSRYNCSLNLLFKNTSFEKAQTKYFLSRSGSNDSYRTCYDITVRLKKKEHLLYTVCSENDVDAEPVGENLFAKKKEYSFSVVEKMIEKVNKEWILCVSTSKLYSHDDYGDSSEFIEKKELSITEEFLMIENEIPVGCYFGNGEAILFNNANGKKVFVYGEWSHESRLMSTCYKDCYTLKRIENIDD